MYTTLYKSDKFCFFRSFSRKNFLDGCKSTRGPTPRTPGEVLLKKGLRKCLLCSRKVATGGKKFSFADLDIGKKIALIAFLLFSKASKAQYH